MPYVLKTPEGSYVKQTLGTFEITKSFSLATKWKHKSQAENQLKYLNGKKYFKYKRLRIEHVVDVMDESGNHSKDTIPVSEVENTDTDFCVVDKARDFVTYASKLVAKKSELIQQLSLVDQEIIDIEHKIEFSKLSASEGYKMYKRFHDTANKRRKIKDDLFVINSLIPAVNADQVEDVQKKLISLEDRVYHPRVDAELFK